MGLGCDSWGCRIYSTTDCQLNFSTLFLNGCGISCRVCLKDFLLAFDLVPATFVFYSPYISRREWRVWVICKLCFVNLYPKSRLGRQFYVTVIWLKIALGYVSTNIFDIYEIFVYEKIGDGCRGVHRRSATDRSGVITVG